LGAALLWAEGAESLKRETLEAFLSYVRKREADLDTGRLRGPRFLWVDDDVDRKALVKAGEVVIEGFSGKGSVEVRAGLIHDWIGAAFIPGAKLAAVMAMVQDYDNHKSVYQPEVIDSKLRAKSGNRYKVHLRLLKRKVITVVLNTEHDVEYASLGPSRIHSRSYSTRIAEVEDPGTARERERPLEQSHGFLWRLNSYWRFEQRDGGVYVECEAISLTRGVPFGLGMIVMPIIRDLPRESLRRTLEATRDGLHR
jgi:hypothetical protein